MSLEKDSKQTFAVILPAELAKRYEDKNKELGSGRELMSFLFLGEKYVSDISFYSASYRW